ncbi:hypothetical protein B0H15DRAFT_348651 [Mycena belliarum]|uniref:Uncharacterized protein n=1 Tax=Mycena belliarum TaxID=1033014 RepID=A0AAD6XR24_9AGAR|nr:hypothetical protein B0H15DRAFT_986584 [Mycena belliae]KAJ7086421.1 hypothetical protein B0H15DRAFT_348651 [Mycena belliae]
MSSSRKRKHRPGRGSYVLQDEADTSPDPALFIQAHEAEIVRGAKARRAADSLDITASNKPAGLIQWNPSDRNPAPFPNDADAGFTPTAQDRRTDTIWVDRYDARLLLDALPKSARQDTPPSPSGWSDLPSDAEDTFFFSPHEAEDYRQEKRRRLLDRAREERLRARKAEEGEPEEEEEEDAWGASDEEPDEAQAALMARTAASIASTVNPAQLEMRILANYGGDRRFAFLRGRWKARWAAMKRDAEKAEEAKKLSAGLGTLADYGDSDEEVDVEPQDDLAARQARAKAWAEARRAAKSTASV